MDDFMRENTFLKTLKILEEKNFSFSTYFHTNNCFDIVAKKLDTLLIIKILENIDALRQEQAQELKRMSNIFNAGAFIIATKTKNFELKNSIIYERLGIKCTTIQTFSRILKNDFPAIKYFKGKNTVEIDSELLKNKRKQLDLSLQELAEKINTTAESIHRFETRGKMLFSTAKLLEKTLQENFIKKINAMKPLKAEKSTQPENISIVFEKIKKLGLDLEFFSHAPFEAFSLERENIYFIQTQRETETKKKAADLVKTKKIVGGTPLIIAKEAKKHSLEQIPIIVEEEIFSMTKKNNLLEIAHQRQKKWKKKK